MVGDVLDAVGKLKTGLNLSMPLSRPMPDVGKGVHELQLKDRSGQYRVIYVLKIGDAIYLIHASKKTSAKTPKKNVEIVKKRIKKI